MHKICSKFYTIGFSCPKIGEIYTTGSDKSHLSLPTCTKFALHFFLSNFYCTNTTTACRIAAESPQVSTRKFLALQLGQTTACWGLQEKLWGRPWLKMMILPLKFALGGGKYPSFENQICKFYVFLYDYSLRLFSCLSLQRPLVLPVHTRYKSK